VAVGVGVGVAVGVTVGVTVGVAVEVDVGDGVVAVGGVNVLAADVGVSGAAMWVNVRATGRGVGVARWQAVSAWVLARMGRMKTSRVREVTRTGNLPSLPRKLKRCTNRNRTSDPSMRFELPGRLLAWPYVTTFQWI
jgi:hypothetical protein